MVDMDRQFCQFASAIHLYALNAVYGIQILLAFVKRRMLDSKKKTMPKKTKEKWAIFVAFNISNCAYCNTIYSAYYYFNVPLSPI